MPLRPLLSRQGGSDCPWRTGAWVAVRTCLIVTVCVTQPRSRVAERPTQHSYPPGPQVPGASASGMDIPFCFFLGVL